MPTHDAAEGQAPECQFCPLCQAMAALRSARPEAVEHLVKAGAELLLLHSGDHDHAAHEVADHLPEDRRHGVQVTTAMPMIHS